MEVRKGHRQVAAFILAGGASSRMRADKALLRIAGVTLLTRTAHLIQPLVNKVTVIGWPRPCGNMPLLTIPDQPLVTREAKALPFGPLVGIATALTHTQSPWNLIAACDLPYLSEEWLEWLLARAVRSRCQAVVPRTANGLEPLAAVYRRECASAIASALDRGVRKVIAAIDELCPEIIEERSWRHLDHQGTVLKNMNTPEDYAEARIRATRLWGDAAGLRSCDWRRR